MQMMASSLSKLIKFKETTSGDTAGAGLSFILCKHIESFKAKVQTITRRKQKMAKMTIGGAITRLLKKAGVSFTAHQHEAIAPRYINAAYLRTNSFLTGPKGKSDYYYYQFPLPSNQSAIIRLPDTEITILTAQKNYAFIPPPKLLIDSNTLTPSPEKVPTEKSGTPGSSMQKQKVAITPAGRGSAAKTCECTQKGFREKLAAEIESSLQQRFQRQLAEIESRLQKQHRREIEDLTRTFVRRSEIHNPPPSKTSRDPPAHHNCIDRSRERARSSDEDFEDMMPLSKRAANNNRHRHHPPSNGA